MTPRFTDKVMVVTGAAQGIGRRVAELAPDYRLNARSIVERGEDILVSGDADTTSPAMASATQWRARAGDGKLREWQSYSNTLTPSMIAMVQSSYK